MREFSGHGVLPRSASGTPRRAIRLGTSLKLNRPPIYLTGFANRVSPLGFPVLLANNVPSVVVGMAVDNREATAGEEPIIRALTHDALARAHFDNALQP